MKQSNIKTTPFEINYDSSGKNGINKALDMISTTPLEIDSDSALNTLGVLEKTSDKSSYNGYTLVFGAIAIGGTAMCMLQLYKMYLRNYSSPLLDDARRTKDDLNQKISRNKEYNQEQQQRHDEKAPLREKYEQIDADIQENEQILAQRRAKKNNIN